MNYPATIRRDVHGIAGDIASVGPADYPLKCPGNCREVAGKFPVKMPGKNHDASALKSWRESEADYVSPVVASISCSPCHPSALQIDSPPGSGGLPL
jgi:hypothetical protein